MVNENLRKLLNKIEKKRTVEDVELRGGARAPFEHVKPVVGGSKKKKNYKKIGEKHIKEIIKKEKIKTGDEFEELMEGMKGMKGSGYFQDLAKDWKLLEKDTKRMFGGGGGMFNSTMINGEAPKNVNYPDVSIPRGRGRPATKKAKTKRKLSEKQIKRNNLVKHIMKEYGVSLPEASKYIKENNLI